MPIPQPQGSSRKIISHGIEGNKESRGILVQGLVCGEFVLSEIPSPACSEFAQPTGEVPIPVSWAVPTRAGCGSLFVPSRDLEEPLAPCLGLDALTCTGVCKAFCDGSSLSALSFPPRGCDRSPSDAQSSALLAKCSNLTLYQPCLQQLSVTMTTILTLVMALL